MPSNGISNSDLLDLQRTTLENLPKLDFETALTYQNYIALNQWFSKEKIQVDSGTSIKRNILLDNSGNASYVRLYGRTAINVTDVQKQITAPWVQVRTHYSIDRREVLRNRSPARYIELLKSRRLDGMLALADLIERTSWGTPQNTSDDLNPRGLAYWISKVVPSNAGSYDAAIDVAGTFCGRRINYGDGTFSYTDKGGINPTAEGKWRNYADVYSAVSTSDLVRKLRSAFYATSFQSPMVAKDLKEGPASKYKLYTGRSVAVALDELSQTQNVGSDLLAGDLAKFHGVSVFKRVPIIYAPVLDADATNPIYGVNHAKFFPIVMEGDWLRESEPMSDVETHDVSTTFIDSSFQLFSNNVRDGGFVLHTAQAG